MGMTTEHDPDDAPLSPSQAEAAASYHAPPESVPRDAMWAAIQARRAPQSTVPGVVIRPDVVVPPPLVVTHTTRREVRRLMPRWAIAMATAAAVVLMVSVARQRAATRASEPVARNAATVAAQASADSGAAWRVASTEHFGVAETMLTALGTSTDVQSDRQLTAWSRDLLESTRLLMDSPAGRDPRRRLLLQELELILVQLVESGPVLRSDDRSVLDQLLSQSSLLLTRIRTTVPAGLPASNP
jgi:hypothetical protein